LEETNHRTTYFHKLDVGKQITEQLIFLQFDVEEKKEQQPLSFYEIHLAETNRQVIE